MNSATYTTLIWRVGPGARRKSACGGCCSGTLVTMTVAAMRAGMLKALDSGDAHVKRQTISPKIIIAKMSEVIKEVGVIWLGGESRRQALNDCTNVSIRSLGRVASHI